MLRLTDREKTELIRVEKERRRTARLKQVRQQSEANARTIVRTVQFVKREVLQKIANDVTEELRETVASRVSIETSRRSLSRASSGFGSTDSVVRSSSQASRPPLGESDHSNHANLPLASTNTNTSYDDELISEMPSSFCERVRSGEGSASKQRSTRQTEADSRGAAQETAGSDRPKATCGNSGDSDNALGCESICTTDKPIRALELGGSKMATQKGGNCTIT
ncbi:hypothetical protein WR25_07784 [Diploscapter pachys]|uniref:Uncharacterized protein n=1 Tax=Diploscapter pachys TaxID=2018661 RepID=A0A2A2JPN8_9BILA|nr:hypothetical protein WR25_07784 [Diploscapter pachys]